ncbi:MAG: alpha/beta hydrolase, partial [Bryobacteraceae bacterium]
WRAIESGKYYMIVRNRGAQGGPVAIEVLPRDAGRSPAAIQQPSAGLMNVYYATDRRRTGQSGKGATYGGEPTDGDRIEYGIAKVSIPRAHLMGELEGPTLLKLEFREDPEKHVVLLSATPESADSFYRHAGERIAESSARQALVFVHGFNVTFEDAARRTAQIAYDLGFDGAAILYSWPSQGRLGLIDYNKDGRNAELSVPHLRAFLSQLSARTGVRTIHLIAHSMGNRVAVNALAQTPGQAAGRGFRVREVALMAPDIDAAEFRRLAAAMRSKADRVTLYASSGDEALKTSEKLSGYPRAGEGGDQILVAPGMDTIDASSVDTSLLGLGHSYFADNSTILSDLFRLIRGDAPRDRPRLRPAMSAQGPYWIFAPAAR